MITRLKADVLNSGHANATLGRIRAWLFHGSDLAACSRSQRSCVQRTPRDAKMTTKSRHFASRAELALHEGEVEKCTRAFFNGLLEPRMRVLAVAARRIPINSAVSCDAQE